MRRKNIVLNYKVIEQTAEFDSMDAFEYLMLEFEITERMRKLAKESGNDRVERIIKLIEEKSKRATLSSQ